MRENIAVLTAILALHVAGVLHTYVAIALALVHLLLPLDASIFPPRLPISSAFFQSRIDSLSNHEMTWAEATRGAPRTGEHYAVVGGSGFLGSRLVHALVQRGEKHVRVVDVDQAGLEKIKRLYPSVEIKCADVRSMDDLAKALRGIDCVFSPFAAIRFFERLPHQYVRSASINVDGTAVLLQACKLCGVKRLVHTSTGNVTLSFPGQVSGICDETTPLVGTKSDNPPLHNYARTKAEAEMLVLQANGPELATASIRPCSNVFGFNDKLQIERILKSRAAVTMDVRTFGDWVHVDCLVVAHLLLDAKLKVKQSGCAGEAFCITGGQPCSDGLFFAALAREAERILGGKRISNIRLPARLMHLVAMVVDLVHLANMEHLLPRDLAILTTSTLLSSMALNLCSEAKARRLLGYQPPLGVLAAIRKTLLEFKHDKVCMDTLS